MLEKNLMGVDKNPNAVRVASFSLYLAMCDEIDPRYYWNKVRFPRLRNRRILSSDFFAETWQGISSTENAHSYDIVIGNPPWGDASITPLAQSWTEANNWPIANNDIGPIFLGKAATLAKPGGEICLLQPVSALLYNQSPKAKTLRQHIFFDFIDVKCIINLAAFRSLFFTNSRAPTCIVHAINTLRTGESISYQCPKPFYTIEDTYRIIIEEQDIHAISYWDIKQDPWVWSVLMWGGNRDRILIRKLMGQSSLDKEAKNITIKKRQGYITGDQSKRIKLSHPYPILEGPDFPLIDGYYLNASTLPLCEEIVVHSKDTTSLEAFSFPQLIVKTGWIKSLFRFQAKFVQNGTQSLHSQLTGGVICSRNFVSIHATDSALLETCCACYNSDIANYFLLLTSGRFAFEREEPAMSDLYKLPIPKDRADAHPLANIQTFEDLNKKVASMFRLSEAEQILQN
jgi:N-6 DNA Methylase